MISKTGYTFTPPWWGTLLTALLLALFLSLGSWQLRRALFKQTLEAQFSQVEQAAIPLNQLSGNAEQDRFRPVIVQGSFTGQNILVDNRFYQHQPGFDVYSALQLDNGKIMLVNRGWVARGRQRDQLPTFEKIAGTQTLQGIVQPLPKTVYTLGEQASGWPRIIENISQQEINHAFTNQNVLPFALVLDEKSRHTLTYHFVATTMPAARHFGYMVQWYGLAAALLIIYIVMNTRRKVN